MSFRNHSRGQVANAVRSWADWRKENAELIEQTGLPLYCFTMENWDELLEYGSLVHNPVSINDLPLRQKAAFLRLIVTRPKDLTSHAVHLLILALLDAVEHIDTC